MITSYLQLLRQSLRALGLKVLACRENQSDCWRHKKTLLGWIRHLSAEETQRLETLADGVDVGHAHKHHLTVGIVLWNRRKTMKHTTQQKLVEVLILARRRVISAVN